MLVTFSVENFRSFKEETTISLVASKRFTGNHDSHLVPIPGTDQSVLRTAIIYGANGAGKSNLFKALQFACSMAIRERRKGEGTRVQPFLFRSDHNASSSFDIQFIAANKLFRYGMILNKESVLEEWLLEIDGSKENVIFEREKGPEGNLSVRLLDRNKAFKKLRALATVGGPDEQSFLAFIHKNINPDETPEPILDAIAWFDDQLSLVHPDSNFFGLAARLQSSDDFRRFTADFLRGASTGVTDLRVHSDLMTEEQAKIIFPESLYGEIYSDAEDEDGKVVLVGEDREVLRKQEGGKGYQVLTIQSVHKTKNGEQVSLRFGEESDGTRRLLNLLPALHKAADSSAVFFIDEIERSMHPLLIRKFIEFFLSSCKGNNRQLLFTTHESTLLDQDLIRRDEVWFAEKDQNGVSHLYSLAEFKPRKDLRVDKHYLQGRFGAVPFLSDIDNLLTKEGKEEDV